MFYNWYISIHYIHYLPTQHSDNSFLPLVDSPAKNRNIIIYAGQTVDTILMALMYHPDYEYFHNTTVIREY